MEWPAKEDLRPVPPLYEALEGYPGVFICVEVCDVSFCLILMPLAKHRLYSSSKYFVNV